MAQILCKGGVEPPDVKVTKGEGKPMATYTGAVEEPPEVEVEETTEERPAESSQMSTNALGEMIARTRENLERQMQQNGRARPAEAVHKPVVEPADEQQQSQKTPMNSSRAMTSRSAALRGASAEIYSLADRRRKIEIDEESQIIIAGGESRRVPVLRSLATAGGAVALVFESEPEETAKPETKPAAKAKPRPEPRPKGAQVVPLKRPLTEEQKKAEEQKAEMFYQQTGMTPEEFREMFTPGWTVAEALSPRENARRIKLGVRNIGYDAELTMAKAKKAVREFLYKKRPMPGQKAMNAKPATAET